jgi:hypothetical protein
MVAHFGVDIMHVIDGEPARLAEVGGLGPKRTAMIAAAWAEQKAIKEVMIFLQRHGQRPPPHRTRPPPKPAPARPLKRCNTESTRRSITSCHRYHATSTWFILSATCGRATVQYPILPKAGGAASIIMR